MPPRNSIHFICIIFYIHVLHTPFVTEGVNYVFNIDKTIVHLIITIGWDGSGSLAYVGFELIDC